MEEQKNVGTKRNVRPKLRLAGWITFGVGCLTMIISIICLIIIGAKDYTKNKAYEFKVSFLGANMCAEITLYDDGTYVETYDFMGEADISYGKYFVIGGKLFVNDSSDDGTMNDEGYVEYGKISATKIVITNEETGVNPKMICKRTKTKQNVAIAFTVVGVVLVAISITGVVLTYVIKGKHIESQQNVMAKKDDKAEDSNKNSEN